ncbi:MAG: hypothetical protein K2X69_09725 [Silvanigrellaceae bacterium]|nr:hypothetical protein [Silvanigrellaceae bacterium]
MRKLNLIEASKAANVSVTSIKRWINEGKINAESKKIKNKLSWKIEEKNLNDFLKKRPLTNSPSFSDKDFMSNLIQDLKKSIENYQSLNFNLQERLNTVEKYNEKLLEQNSKLQSQNIELSKEVLNFIKSKHL